MSKENRQHILQWRFRFIHSKWATVVVVAATVAAAAHVPSKGNVRKWEFSHFHEYVCNVFVFAWEMKACWYMMLANFRVCTVIVLVACTCCIQHQTSTTYTLTHAHSPLHSQLFRFARHWEIMEYRCNWRTGSCVMALVAVVCCASAARAQYLHFHAIHSIYTLEKCERKKKLKATKTSACSFCFFLLYIFSLLHFAITMNENSGKNSSKLCQCAHERHMVFFLFLYSPGLW